MDNKITIALVSAFPPGSQSLNEYGYHFAKELIKNDHVEKVIVIADILDDPKNETLVDPKLEIRRCWRFNDVFSLPKIIRNLKQVNPDGVIYNLQTASFGDREIPAALGLMTPMVSRIFGYFSGVIAHNIIAGIELESTLLKGKKIRQKLVQFGGHIITKFMSMANYMTVTLPSYYEHLNKHFPNANIEHIPHGTFEIDGAFPPLQDRPKHIVTMGKFGTYKRLDTLLTAFDLLRNKEKFSNYKLIIAGSDHPNSIGYVEEIAQSRKHDKQIIFKGYLPEEQVADFFKNARLSVFDYNSTTGSSGVLHQTASYGSAPVFPSIGDFIDVCEDEGIKGFYYPPNSAHDMAQAILDALLNLPLSQKIVNENQKAVMEMPLSKITDYHVHKILQKYTP